MQVLFARTYVATTPSWHMSGNHNWNKFVQKEPDDLWLWPYILSYLERT
jgi:hypothetical protein